MLRLLQATIATCCEAWSVRVTFEILPRVTGTACNAVDRAQLKVPTVVNTKEALRCCEAQANIRQIEAYPAVRRMKSCMLTFRLGM
jgi:hypothetical protein